jgi:hypothetical protein
MPAAILLRTSSIEGFLPMSSAARMTQHAAVVRVDREYRGVIPPCPSLIRRRFRFHFMRNLFMPCTKSPPPGILLRAPPHRC